MNDSSETNNNANTINITTATTTKLRKVTGVEMDAVRMCSKACSIYIASSL